MSPLPDHSLARTQPMEWNSSSLFAEKIEGRTGRETTTGDHGRPPPIQSSRPWAHVGTAAIQLPTPPVLL